MPLNFCISKSKHLNIYIWIFLQLTFFINSPSFLSFKPSYIPLRSMMNAALTVELTQVFKQFVVTNCSKERPSSIVTILFKLYFCISKSKHLNIYIWIFLQLTFFINSPSFLSFKPSYIPLRSMMNAALTVELTQVFKQFVVTNCSKERPSSIVTILFKLYFCISKSKHLNIYIWIFLQLTFFINSPSFLSFKPSYIPLRSMMNAALTVELTQVFKQFVVTNCSKERPSSIVTILFKLYFCISKSKHLNIYIWIFLQLTFFINSPSFLSFKPSYIPLRSMMNAALTVELTQVFKQFVVTNCSKERPSSIVTILFKL